MMEEERRNPNLTNALPKCHTKCSGNESFILYTFSRFPLSAPKPSYRLRFNVLGCGCLISGSLSSSDGSVSSSDSCSLCSSSAELASSASSSEVSSASSSNMPWPSPPSSFSLSSSDSCATPFGIPSSLSSSASVAIDFGVPVNALRFEAEGFNNLRSALSSVSASSSSSDQSSSWPSMYSTASSSSSSSALLRAAPCIFLLSSSCALNKSSLPLRCNRGCRPLARSLTTCDKDLILFMTSGCVARYPPWVTNVHCTQTIKLLVRPGRLCILSAS